MHSSYSILSTTSIIAGFLMMSAVLFFAFTLRQLIQILDDPSLLESQYAEINGEDKYTHKYFPRWRRKFLLIRIIILALSAAVFLLTYRFLLM